MANTTHHSAGDHTPHARHVAAISPDSLKDPVCGMTVTEQAKYKLVHEGRPYYFCSAKCEGKFSADPQKYLAPAQSSAAATDAPAAGTI